MLGVSFLTAATGAIQVLLTSLAQHLTTHEGCVPLLRILQSFDQETPALDFHPPITRSPPQNAQVLNVQSVGAFGDGRHDDTKALQAAILQSRTVFVPFGIYMISDTLVLSLPPSPLLPPPSLSRVCLSFVYPEAGSSVQVLRPDSRIVGEGYS
eukprot:COSAG03_NODE_10904_length_622_cov_18.967495_1_plen_153_part_01